MSWLTKILGLDPIESVKPEDWGWVEQLPKWNNKPKYELGNYTLYKSCGRGWVFDCKTKNAPGIIARFDDPLLDADLDYAREYMKRVG